MKSSVTQKRLFDELFKLGLDPSFEYRISKMHVDIALPKHKIAIEVDGENFHNGKDRIKDYNRDIILQQEGWIVIRFDAREVHESPSKVAWRIQQVVKNKAKNSGGTKRNIDDEIELFDTMWSSSEDKVNGTYNTYKPHTKASREGLLWSEKERSQLKKMYLSGKEITDIAEALSRPDDAIVFQLIKLNILGYDENFEEDPERHEFLWSNSELDTLKKEISQGLSIQRIAENHKRKRNAILFRLIKMNYINYRDRRVLDKYKDTLRKQEDITEKKEDLLQQENETPIQTRTDTKPKKKRIIKKATEKEKNQKCETCGRLINHKGNCYPCNIKNKIKKLINKQK